MKRPVTAMNKFIEGLIDDAKSKSGYTQGQISESLGYEYSFLTHRKSRGQLYKLPFDCVVQIAKLAGKEVEITGGLKI